MNYKNLAITVMSVVILAAGTSCHRLGRSRTVISTNENGNVQRIEYSGTVVFNQERTGVDYISDGGFLKFEHNGQKIEAKSDSKGKVKYEYNGDEVAKLDEPGKALLAEAVKAASAQQAKVKAEQGR